METKTLLICSMLMVLFISAMAMDEEVQAAEVAAPKYHGIRAERGAIKNALKGAAVGAVSGAAVKASTGHGGAGKGAALGAVANTAAHAMKGGKNH